MSLTLKDFEEAIVKILLSYPNPDSLQELPNIIEIFASMERSNIDKIITRTLYSNPGYTRAEIEMIFMQVFRNHFNI
jgi:hypothetical protein